MGIEVALYIMTTEASDTPMRLTVFSASYSFRPRVMAEKVGAYDVLYRQWASPRVARSQISAMRKAVAKAEEMALADRAYVTFARFLRTVLVGLERYPRAFLETHEF